MPVWIGQQHLFDGLETVLAFLVHGVIVNISGYFGNPEIFVLVRDVLTTAETP